MIHLWGRVVAKPAIMRRGYHRRAETRLAFGMRLSLPNRSAPNPNVRNLQMSPLNAGQHGSREPQVIMKSFVPRYLAISEASWTLALNREDVKHNPEIAGFSRNDYEC
jgi:hypothetical protein